MPLRFILGCFRKFSIYSDLRGFSLINCVCRVGFLKYELLALSRSRERCTQSSGMMKHRSRENDVLGFENISSWDSECICIQVTLRAFWRFPEMFQLR